MKKIWYSKRVIFLVIVTVIMVLVFSFKTFSHNITQNSGNLKSKYTVLNTHANYIKYGNLDELTAKADLIVIAKPYTEITNDKKYIKRFKDTNDIIDYHTISPVQVLKVIKGDKQLGNAKVSIFQRAVILDEKYEQGRNILIKPEEYTVLKDGATYLLFLAKIGDDQYSILGLNQGKMNIDGQDKDEQDLAEGIKHYSELKNSALNKYKKEIQQYKN